MNKIREKIKPHLFTIILFLTMTIISVITDVVIGKFSLYKYIAYAIIFILMLVIVLTANLGFLGKIWKFLAERLNKYKLPIIMFLIMLVVTGIFDTLSNGFEIYKYVAYGVVLLILVILALYKKIE